MVVRNIRVHFVTKAGHVSQLFTDWYDFADWLKQSTLNREVVSINGWNYEDKHL